MLSMSDSSGHSPHNCFVYTLQADVTFQNVAIIFFSLFFILSVSTQWSLPKQFSVYTLQADVWFTLSNHMLGYNFFKFSWAFIFSMLSFCKHIFVVNLLTFILFTLSNRMLQFKILQSWLISFCSCLYSLHIFNVHSPNSFLFTLSKQMFRYTLQAHVRFLFF